MRPPNANPITRRKLIYGGVAAAAGVGGLAAADRMAKRYGLIPPDGGGVYGPGENADLCLPAHPDDANAGARVSAQHDLEESVRQCNCAAER